MFQKILLNKFFILFAVIFVFLLIDFTNKYLAEFLHLLPGAYLVYAPSGFMLLFVLIAGWIGALGISIATFLASILYKFPSEYFLGFELAFVNGTAPLVARQWCMQKLGMNEDLSNVTAKQLLCVGLIFALIDSALIQTILFWNGISTNFVDGFLIMFIGDISGVYIVFVLLKIISKKLVKVDIRDTK